MFAIIAQLDNAKLQSTISILLVGCMIGLQLKLEPYKVRAPPRLNPLEFAHSDAAHHIAHSDAAHPVQCRPSLSIDWISSCSFP